MLPPLQYSGKIRFIDQTSKSSIPVLSYLQVGGMRHDQELYAKYHTYPPHRAPVEALCEGSSMRPCRYAQSSDRSSMRRELYAALHSSFRKIMTCISSYTHFITPTTKYKNIFWYSEKIHFIEPQGINVRPVPGTSSSGTSRESQAIFRDETVWVLKKGPVGTGPAGSVFGENSFYRETRGSREGRSPNG